MIGTSGREEFTMKSKNVILSAALLIALGGAVALTGQEAQAAKKKVKAVVKGSTLTVSGKGAMPSNLKIKKSKIKKVRKIVIKKGVTSIPVDAFRKYKNATSATVPSSVKTIGQSAFRCEKLKKLTLPGKFEIKYLKGSRKRYWITDTIDTVAFNTNLDLKMTAFFDTNNLVVKKTDPKYKSVKGIIYSKDGKEIVRVPYQRSEAVIADGSEVFCLQSVMYANPLAPGKQSGGCRVKKIVLPASIKKIEAESYAAECQDGLKKRIVAGKMTGLQLDIRAKQLDGQSIAELMHTLRFDVNDIMRQFPERILLSGDYYILDKNILFHYAGKDSEIKFPEGITVVGNYAFCDNQGVEKLELPEGLTEVGKYSFSKSSKLDGELALQQEMEVTFPSTLKRIGDRAFSNNKISKVVLPASLESCGDGAFMETAMEELVLPEGMKVIPENMAFGNYLKKIVLPDSVEVIGGEAFSLNHLEEIQFGKNVREIGQRAFTGNPLKQLTIPNTVTKIGDEAFDGIYGFDIVIQGESKGFSNTAFSPFCTLVYAKGPQEMKAALDDLFVRSCNKKKAVVKVVWSEVKDADGYELVAAANAKYTKSKKKMTIKTSSFVKDITLKGKFYSDTTIYVKIRPYSYLDGKKIYGRWSEAKRKCKS